MSILIDLGACCVIFLRRKMFLSAPQDGAKLTKTDRPGKHAPNKRGNTTVARNLGGAGAGATARILGSRGAGVGFVAVGDAPPRFGFAELVARGPIADEQQLGGTGAG